MRLAGVRLESLLDGDGVNLVVFFQGCTIKCPGCHNPELQDENGGEAIDFEKVFEYATPATTGMVLSGGEPTDQIIDALTLASMARERGLKTTIFTGHTLEWLGSSAMKDIIFNHFDYVKVGPFVQELRNTSNGPMGSTNQVMIDVDCYKD